MNATFEENGFLLVSGLIDKDVVERAYRRLLSLTPSDAAGSYHQFVRDREVVGCFNDRVCSTAQELAGSRKRFKRPGVTYTVTVLPSNAAWEWPPPHIDHSHEKDAHRVFPPPFRIGCLIYLNDVPLHSGGTIVWPGSHRQLETLAAAHPHEYALMSALYRDLHKLSLNSPQELPAATGDVLFYHYLLAHSGSTNVSANPRAALNHKW